jgi:hypothetical protein
MRPHALDALAEVFELELEELPADAARALRPQPLPENVAARMTLCS